MSDDKQTKWKDKKSLHGIKDLKDKLKELKSLLEKEKERLIKKQGSNNG